MACHMQIGTTWHNDAIRYHQRRRLTSQAAAAAAATAAAATPAYSANNLQVLAVVLVAVVTKRRSNYDFFTSVKVSLANCTRNRVLLFNEHAP